MPTPQRHADDFTVIWRGMSIGRIMRAPGLPPLVPQWRWTCNAPASRAAAADRAAISTTAKAQFRAAWARIRAGLTDADIAKAHRYAEALARYDRKGGPA
jgi:hypothetical protein